MPETPIYGLPVEVPADQPGVTLTGGPSGTENILAEAVEDELSRIDSDISDANEAIVEAARGWRPIVFDTFSGQPPFTVDLTAGGKFPVGTFAATRVRARGSLQGGAGVVTMRINNDTTEDMHVSSLVRWVASDGSVADTDFAESTVWRLARWGSLTSRSNLECVIFHSDVSAIPSFQSSSRQLGSSAAASFVTECWGALSQSRQVSSLRFSTLAGDPDFAQFHYQIEGWVGP